MEVIISASEVYKNFYLGEVKIEVLKDISLSITRGEFIRLMGPS